MISSKIRCFAALLAATAPLVTTSVEAQPAQAQQEYSSRAQSAITFADALTTDANAAFSDNGASETEQLDQFKDVLFNGLAIETIGKFVLGEARKSISDEQTARYNDIFPEYITQLYARQFQDILGKPLTVIDAQEIGARDVIVRTRFDRTDANPINVDWRVRTLRSGDHKAIDIIVSGVSIMLVKREEFSSYVASNGIDALIDRLEHETQI